MRVHVICEDLVMSPKWKVTVTELPEIEIHYQPISMPKPDLEEITDLLIKEYQELIKKNEDIIKVEGVVSFTFKEAGIEL